MILICANIHLYELLYAKINLRMYDRFRVNQFDDTNMN